MNIHRNLHNRHSIAYYHSIGKNHHLYSLENLSQEIDLIYPYYKKYISLNSEKVSNIQKSILSGTYRLSPFGIKLTPRNQSIDLIPYEFVMYCEEFPNKRVIITASEEDLLVLTALGKVLNDIFDSLGYNSIVITTHSFYEDVLLLKRNVDSLYRFDMSRSMFTFNQEELRKDLESILGKTPIFDFVLSFLHADYNEYNGFSFTRLSIPPVCFLSNVLHNFVINKLDTAMMKSFDDKLHYDRHMHEVYISNCFYCYNDFKSIISSLFDDLGLAGKMYYIERGTNAPCFIGIVGLDNDGQIYIEYK